MLMHLAMPNDFLAGSSRRMSLAPLINMESSAPRIMTSEKWNAHDDQTLMTARAQGLNWAPIQLRHFPTKTPNACRKRHERLMEKRSAEDWSPEQLENLGREYAAVRKDMWSMLAARLGGEKWQIVEKKCMEKGLKNLQAAGRAASKRDRTLGNDDSGFAENDTEFDLEGDDIPRHEHQALEEEGGPRGTKRQRTSIDISNIGSILHPTT